MSENIVKKTCKELGITYKELGEKIGYSEGALKTASSTGNISEPMKKAIELYLEILRLKEVLTDFKTLTSIIKKYT
ncbi:MAG: transcriptional regulator [Campylobacteraceae bacterium]|jgi:hypothetical protein|nr:transcriptional regulator [Campylobacteraceae bacterium]